MPVCHWHPYQPAVGELEVVTKTLPPTVPTSKGEWPLCQDCIDNFAKRFSFFFHADTRFTVFHPLPDPEPPPE